MAHRKPRFTYDVPDVDYYGKVRDRDPETSWLAAGRQTRTKTQKLRNELLVILQTVGPLTHEELVAFRSELRKRYPDLYKPSSESGIRTRTKELERDGRVRIADELGRTRMDGESQKWEAIA